MQPARASLRAHARLQPQTVCGASGGSIVTSRSGSGSGTLGGIGSGVGTGSGVIGVLGVSGTIGVGDSPGWGTLRSGDERASVRNMAPAYPKGVSDNRSRSSASES